MFISPVCRNLFLFCLALSLTAGQARADFVTGAGAYGSFDGTITYSDGVLTLTVTNTSPEENGGYLTALAFNNPGGKLTPVSLGSTNSNFGLLGGPQYDDTVNGAPYGQYDIGVSTGSSFEGGGPPSRGIGVGESATFTFTFTGTDLDTLTVHDFAQEVSAPPGAGQGARSFLARFRGFEDGQSDKVPGLTHNPEPSSLVLGCLGGLLGYLGARRRRASRGKTVALAQDLPADEAR